MQDLDAIMHSFDEVRHRPAVAKWLHRLAAHDRDLLRHSLLVGVVMAVFAHKAELSENLRVTLTTGALLHDTGKLTISPTLLQNPKPLSMAERKELQSHAVRGFNMLKAESWSEGVLELVHLHHERLDGSGYPNGYKGIQLSGEVQLLALCDVFSALIEERSYRPRPNRPLDVLTTMTDELDAELLQFFSAEVVKLVYAAQARLQEQSHLEYPLAESA